MSRGFLCAIFGVAMTLFSWFAPWAWPAFPALTTMRLFPDFADFSFAVRGTIIVLVIAINVVFWAAAARVVWWIVQRLTARRRPPVPS
jgi:hypothetical protein